MKRKEIAEFTSILTRVKEIMGEETDFEELRKRERKAIYKLFEDSSIERCYDGDSDGAYAIFRDCDDLDVTFTAYVDSCYDIADNPEEMNIFIKGEEIETIDEALEALKHAKPDNIPLALLNTSILTTAGNYTLEDIDTDAARKIIADADGFIDSAIGHQSTAEIMTTLLDTEVAVNRQIFTQQVGQKALVFKLNGRPQEGKILTIDEINEIGYKFQLLTRIS